ncbi:3-(2,3-dihydroxyphenyl)propionate dioxygenase [Acinetobacter sp. LoGeW2-3]|uniref:3-carboxyethylcatechol 2,3-dioxygenase n=1 Tax=Acinetobacter sp. LoGeW2-3 TaxID=1808001 RepID=UPI000C058A60|nr:3-carboxyethylcatechol 2,3-dioxygenase [Acinetobacter sp. LoGeW2-3]ATO20149.1 3-(2,3-dihydroxyphenyl)propionate dioxygenase [Acinetobacter sp. LoGeW2-3]
MTAYLHCMSHTPLVGIVDPAQTILDAITQTEANIRQQIQAFDPELVILFGPDHYNGFFYDVMPQFCIGMQARAIGDFNTAAGELSVPQADAEALATHMIEAGFDLAVSYQMQVDHAFAQPLETNFSSLTSVPVIPIFINSVAPPMPTFKRAIEFGEALGQYLKNLNKRVLLLASGGLSHQPPVPELVTANDHMKDRLLGSGKNLPADERQLRTQRVIDAAHAFIKDQNCLHPLNPEWDQMFIKCLINSDYQTLANMSNKEVSEIAGKSTHEVKTWVAAARAFQSFGDFKVQSQFYEPIPEWIAGYGILSAKLV